MKKLALMGIALLLFSCKKEEKIATKIEEKSPTKDSVVVVEEEFHKDLYGIYTGDFVGKEKIRYEESEEEYEDLVYKKISLKINRITKDSVYGHSIVNGNLRPIRGVFNENSKSFVLDEPGNDKTDGRFEMNLKGDSLNGKWFAYTKSTVKAPIKNLKLIKKVFAYNPNFMIQKETFEEYEDQAPVDWAQAKTEEHHKVDDEGKPYSYKTTKYRTSTAAVFTINASKQKLTEKELKNLRKLDLQIIKNTVFARHGYSFKKETYRNFFENTDWYVPVSNNVDVDLTPLEKENVALLARLEKYAEDHYDTFGR